MFMVVLLVIAKVWKQLKCPTAVAWIMYGIVANGIVCSNEKGMNYHYKQRRG